MAHSTLGYQSLLARTKGFQRLHVSDPLTQCLVPRLSRTYATHADLPLPETTIESVSKTSPKSRSSRQVALPKGPGPVLTTLYSWPTMEPHKFCRYPENQLNVPLRKDILHRAVVYEGDMTRQGSASTKHRTQVRGSGRKLRPQKGSGRARLSDKKSPSLRGGGVAHGPHPRDFSTGLPRKIYDLAWRIALSYRYKKGELIILKNRIELPEICTARWLNNFFVANQWGKGNGRSLVVRQTWDENDQKEAESRLLKGLEQIDEHVKLKDASNVDVKDLLSCGRIIIEQPALEEILRKRSKFIAVKPAKV